MYKVNSYQFSVIPLAHVSCQMRSAIVRKVLSFSLSLLPFAFCLLPFSLRAQSTPLFLKELHLDFDKKVNFPQGSLQRQYQNRPFTPRLREQIREKTREALRERGYYFARFVDEQVDADSTEQAIYYRLSVNAGGVLKLDSLQISSPDSLDEELWVDIADIHDEYRGRAYTEPLSSALFRDLVVLFENRGFPHLAVGVSDYDDLFGHFQGAGEGNGADNVCIRTADDIPRGSQPDEVTAFQPQGIRQQRVEPLVDAGQRDDRQGVGIENPFRAALVRTMNGIMIRF